MSSPTPVRAGEDAGREAGQTAYEAWVEREWQFCQLTPWSGVSDRAKKDWAHIERASASAAEAEVARLRGENDRLRIAFHDATRRPLGVTPDSGTEFYDQRMADEAEERRAGGYAQDIITRVGRAEAIARAAALADAQERDRRARTALTEGAPTDV